MLRVILTIVQIFASVAIIGLVLLQRGKGAEAGAGFGAGASGTVFGARGATTALSRATAIFFAIFLVNSLALAYMGGRGSTAEQPKNTILDTVGKKASASKPEALTPPPAAAAAESAASPPAPPASAPAQPAPPK